MWTRRRFAAMPALGLMAQSSPAWQVSDKLSTELAAFTLSGDGLLAAVSQTRLFTSRDGFSWQPAELPSPAVSVAFAGEAVVLASSDGLFRSTDVGKSWKLTHKIPGLTMVSFADLNRGFATGSTKTIVETSDGGQTWTTMAAAAEPATKAGTTTYHWVDFMNPRVGVITGASAPPRKGLSGPLPAWRDPKKAQRREEWPAASLTLETRDAGLTWKHSSISLFGKITRVRYARDGNGIALVEFHERFEYPSEVFSIDLRNGGASQRAFRRTDRAVTDLLLFPGRRAILGAIQPPARPEHSTFGVVCMLESTNLEDWEEQGVARDASQEITAGRVWLAGWSPTDLWAATDTGVILRRKG